MKNILFVIPHPDDEIVGCCALIKKFHQKKQNVILFFLTNGIIDEKLMWPWDKKKYKKILSIRKKEMISSVKYLEVGEYFFQNIPSRTLKDNIEKTYKKLFEIVISKKIDSIFCPAYEGGHQDHDVSNFIASRFVKSCSVYEFAEYNFFNGKVNSNHFIKNSNNYVLLLLDEKLKEFKKKGMQTYISEQKNLGYISLNQECYRPISSYDYSNPPHKGRLFYRRFSFFSWHPRVDRDTPNLICNKILNSSIY